MKCIDKKIFPYYNSFKWEGEEDVEKHARSYCNHGYCGDYRLANSAWHPYRLPLLAFAFRVSENPFWKPDFWRSKVKSLFGLAGQFYDLCLSDAHSDALTPICTFHRCIYRFDVSEICDVCTSV